MEDTVGSHRSDQDLSESLEILGEALGTLRTATEWILERTGTAPGDVLAGACAYLELLAMNVGGWLMVRRAVLARGNESGTRSAVESNFYATEILARAPGLIRPITAGAQRLEGALHRD